jgi:hypothetical protein
MLEVHHPGLLGIIGFASSMGRDPTTGLGLKQIVEYQQSIDYRLLPDATSSVIEEYVGRIRSFESANPPPDFLSRTALMIKMVQTHDWRYRKHLTPLAPS